MTCWNGLGTEMQEFLRTEGYIPWGAKPPAGECPRGAEVEVTTMWDEFPGPRFYCVQCAIDYLDTLLPLDPMLRPIREELGKAMDRKIERLTGKEPI
jgi:hypothetical protein